VIEVDKKREATASIRGYFYQLDAKLWQLHPPATNFRELSTLSKPAIPASFVLFSITHNLPRSSSS
jgi:hypothetical protein